MTELKLNDQLLAVLEQEWLPGMHYVCYAGFQQQFKTNLKIYYIISHHNQETDDKETSKFHQFKDYLILPAVQPATS